LQEILLFQASWTPPVHRGSSPLRTTSLPCLMAISSELKAGAYVHRETSELNLFQRPGDGSRHAQPGMNPHSVVAQ